ncbi:MAG: N-acetylmuramoyl-L-alanine amidase [Myxococcota bacterium]
MTSGLLLLLAAWPADGESLRALEVVAATPTKKVRVFVDAGHGAPGNTGNTGCYGQAEQDHALAVSQHLAFVLSALGPFEVMLSRDGPGTKYPARLAAAKAFRADVIISLHSDARGTVRPWWPYNDERMYWWNADAPGFAVLWNDEGAQATVDGRARLGRAVGQRLRDAGFLAYDGYDYGGLYRQDEVESSAWIDIRPLKKRVYFLRGSTIPTVIIETHHALDPQEVARWSEGKTVDAFSLAIAAALLDFSGAGQPATARPTAAP